MWLLTLGVVAWASSVLGRVLGHLESWGPVLNSHQGDWTHPGEARVGWRLPLALRDSQPTGWTCSCCRDVWLQVFSTLGGCAWPGSFSFCLWLLGGITAASHAGYKLLFMTKTHTHTTGRQLIFLSEHFHIFVFQMLYVHCHTASGWSLSCLMSATRLVVKTA